MQANFLKISPWCYENLSARTKRGIVDDHGRRERKQRRGQCQVAVDTGSTFTNLPREHLVTLGLGLGAQDVFVGILTGSGYIIAPQIRVEWLSCCGFLPKAFPIVAHTLPTGMSQIGLLGMDFLQAAKARIDTYNSLLEIVE